MYSTLKLDITAFGLSLKTKKSYVFLSKKRKKETTTTRRSFNFYYFINVLINSRNKFYNHFICFAFKTERGYSELRNYD